jgi:hypothetical protein
MNEFLGGFESTTLLLEKKALPNPVKNLKFI